MINLAYPKIEAIPVQSSRKKRMGIFFILFLIVLGGASAAWYFLIQHRSNDFTGQAVKIKITAPAEVVAGSSNEYFIEYANQEKIPLKNAKLVVYFPPGFNLVDSLPNPEEREVAQEANVANQIRGESSSRSWEIGDLAPGDKDIIKLKGIFLGKQNTSHILKVSLSYQPANFNSHFSSEQQADILIGEAMVDFSFEAPEKVGKNKDFNLVLKYKNSTSENLENVRIQLTYPHDFAFVSSSPTADRENRVWDFRVLRPGEKGRIEIKGKMTAATAPAIFQADLGVVDQYQQFLSQVQKELSVFVLDPILEITVQANGKEELNLNPGDALDFIITYANLGQVEIQNAKVSFALPTDFFDANSISVEAGRYENGNFIWDYVAQPQLSEVAAGSHSSVKFKAKLLPVFSYSTPDKMNLECKGKAVFESNKLEGLEGFAFKSESNEFIGRLNTELALVQEARYYNFDYEKVGAGPLPPKVGEKTSYRVYWTVTNTTNEANEVRIDTILPPGISWEDDTFVSLGGNIKYDPETRKVAWEVGRLPTFVGSALAGVQGWFTLGATPEAKDIGKILNLTEITRVFGLDAFTDAELKTEYPPLSTDLKNDLGALGKGEVTN